MGTQEPEHGAGGTGLPPLQHVVSAPRRYLGTLRANLKSRLGERGQRGPAIFVLLLAVLVLAAFGYGVSLMLRVPSVEGLEASRYAQSTVLYSADGQQLARYYRENRTWVPLDSIAPIVALALVDTEDRRFFRHWGVDVRRTFGAVFKTVSGDRQGGSTITMQLVRNAYPEIADDFALTRKFEEWLTALQIERHYSKEQILELYLNTVPFNYNAFGIEAAARTYYDKPASRLDTLEAAMLVGMLKGTTFYNPVRNPERALERRAVVLQLMRDAGTISGAQFERFRRQGLDLDFNPVTSEQNQAPYFAEYVRTWLQDWAKEHDIDIYEAGLRVHTTIDARLQAAAEAAVREELDQLQAVVDVSWSRRNLFVSGDPAAYRARRDDVTPFAYYWEANPEVLPSFIEQTEVYRQRVEAGARAAEVLAQLQADEAFVDSLKTAMTRLQAGFLALDPKTGHVKAWVGGADFEHHKYDHVAQSKRQPGSTFKPFVYAAALQKGYSPADYLRDVKVEYVDPHTGKRWEPGNFGSETGDLYALRDGLAHSKNTITAQLILDVGPQKVVELAHRMGVESDLDAVPSLGLGTSVVTLYELVSAYVPFVDQGRYHTPLFVTRIDDAQGNVLATFEPETREALDPSVAYTTLDMMRGVVDGGTAARLRGQYGARGDLAGKTGTTQNAADGWFVLMHPELVTGAWVGFPSPALTFRSEYWGQGAHTALRLVGHFYRDAGLPANARFEVPARYAPPPPGGRLLLASGDGRDTRLEAHDARSIDGFRDGLLPARDASAGAFDLAAGTGEGDGDDRPGDPEARVEARDDHDRGSDDEPEQDEEEDEDENDENRDTDELNERARENSQVRDYLERLRQQKGEDDN